MYVYVKNTDSATNVLFNIASMTSSSKWKIRVEQIACASEMLAPPGCLTYAMTTSGSIQSYNIAGGSGEMINNQKFSHCIKYQEGFCDIAFTASTFDLDPEDSLTIGSNVNSGSTFGVSNMLTCKLENISDIQKYFTQIISVNFTGPYVFPVMADDMNANMKMGYDISYVMLPC